MRATAAAVLSGKRFALMFKCSPFGYLVPAHLSSLFLRRCLPDLFTRCSLSSAVSLHTALSVDSESCVLAAFDLVHESGEKRENG